MIERIRLHYIHIEKFYNASQGRMMQHETV